MSDDEPFDLHPAPFDNTALRLVPSSIFPVRFWRHYCMWRMHFTRWNALQAAWRTAR